MSAVVLTVALLAVSGFLWRRQSNARSRDARLPPGPPGKFIVGNAFDIPIEAPWVWYGGLKEKYGDVSRVTVMGTSIVLLNSFKAVNDLFAKRAANYSDRPRMVLGGEIIGIDNSATLKQHGDEWRTQRRLWTQYMGKSAVSDYDTVIETETQSLARNLVQNDTNITAQLRLCIVKVLMRAGYGIHVNSLEEPFIASTDSANRDVILSLTPGRFLVDVFPIMKYLPTWLPGMEWKRFGIRTRDRVAKFVHDPYQQVKDDVSSGNFQKSLVSEMLASEIGDDKTKMWISGTIYGAGVDTTHTAVNQFVAAMLLYPEIQRRGQAEIDAVIGPNRLPTMEDQASLPYIDAIVQETLRWNLIAPLAIPHVVTTDDEYEGFLLPKGTLCMSNLWALSRDPEMYPNPDEFKPERFLVPAGVTKPVDPRTYIFGVGRRVCVGRYFAERVLHNIVATLLATCTISKSVNSKGEEVEPNVTFMKTSLLQEVEPFEARVRVRSPEALVLMGESM